MLRYVRLFVSASAIMLLSACHTVDTEVDAVDANPGDGICARAPIPGQASTGLCSLRAAIMESNAGFVKATITIPPGTYRLDLPIASGGGVLPITGSVKLQGSGAASTIVEQTVGDAVIHVQGGSGVEINLLTIQGGSSQAGGGIRVTAGTVEMEDLVVRDNFGHTGGGGLVIEAGSIVRIRRATIADNMATGAFGGGIWNQGELWVYDSTISGNDSNRAGGIRNSGNMNLRNVTVSGNTAHSPEAGVGGLSQNGFAVLNNVTITDNTGVGNLAGSFRGGGIQTTAGNLTVMKNSIVAGNDGGTGPDDCVGELAPDSRHNLIGDASECVIAGSLSTYQLGVDPGLGSLANNGGPTRTHMPLAGSPARDSAYEFPPPAANACEASDQRGVPRPQGAGACDLGAVEYTPANTFVTGLVLVDAAADVDLQPLHNDDVLRLELLPSSLSIRAVVTGPTGSVRFDHDGIEQIENVAPYSLGGDTSGNYWPVALSAGEHTLRATPYSGPDGTGAAGGAVAIRFSVIGNSP
ncbi:MAG: hypothetical protein OZ935_13890 [Pseudomonadota bacterium]|nr:hypothetical protein [Pseudomonadota bacterium]